MCSCPNPGQTGLTQPALIGIADGCADFEIILVKNPIHGNEQLWFQAKRLQCLPCLAVNLGLQCQVTINTLNGCSSTGPVNLVLCRPEEVHRLERLLANNLMNGGQTVICMSLSKFPFGLH